MGNYMYMYGFDTLADVLTDENLMTIAMHIQRKHRPLGIFLGLDNREIDDALTKAVYPVDEDLTLFVLTVTRKKMRKCKSH